MAEEISKQTVRMPRGLYEQLIERSAADKRTLNAEIVWLLELALKLKVSFSVAGPHEG